MGLQMEMAMDFEDCGRWGVFMAACRCMFMRRFPFVVVVANERPGRSNRGNNEGASVTPVAEFVAYC